MDIILTNGTRMASRQDSLSSAPMESAEMRPSPKTQQMSIKIPQVSALLHTQEDFDSANLYLLPANFTATAVSNVGAGAVATRIYLLQQDFLNNITTNGSGANSITYSYTDGFSGRNISRAVANARAGVGAITYGTQLTFNNTATGAADVANLNSANAYYATFDPSTGQPSTNKVNTSGDQSRSDTNFGLSVTRDIQNLSCETQLSFVLNVGVTATATFYLTETFRM